MSEYSAWLGSLEYRTFLHDNIDYVDNMGYTSIDAAINDQFLFSEFIKEVTI